MDWRDEKEIDISGVDKADVVRLLYDAAKALGLGLMHYTPEPMTKGEAAALLAEGTYFDYVHGRVMKVDMGEDSFHPGLYDSDNGIGAARKALVPLLGKVTA